MNRIALLAAVGVLGLSSTTASSDELNFSMGADLAYKQLEVSTPEALAPPTGTVVIESKADLWMVSLTPTVSFGRFFASISGERSLGVSNNPTYDQTGKFTNSASTARQENALVVGANVWGGVSVFGGVMKNETEYIKPNYVSLVSDDGPFVGVSFAHSFDAGALSATLAVTAAETEFLQQQSLGDITNGKGKTKGSSFSLMWVAPLGGSWSSRIGYRGTRYKANMTVDTRNIVSGAFTAFNPREIEIKQRYDAFVIGVVKAF